MGANASLKFVNRQRGFMLCDVTRERWETSVHVLDKVSVADGRISTRARLQVAAGSNRVTAS
jgi:alkaline phosphatase D